MPVQSFVFIFRRKPLQSNLQKLNRFLILDLNPSKVFFLKSRNKKKTEISALKFKCRFRLESRQKSIKSLSLDLTSLTSQTKKIQLAKAIIFVQQLISCETISKCFQSSLVKFKLDLVFYLSIYLSNSGNDPFRCLPAHWYSTYGMAD